MPTSNVPNKVYEIHSYTYTKGRNYQEIHFGQGWTSFVDVTTMVMLGFNPTVLLLILTINRNLSPGFLFKVNYEFKSMISMVTERRGTHDE